MTLADNLSAFFVEKSFHVSILMYKQLTAALQPLSLLQFALVVAMQPVASTWLHSNPRDKFKFPGKTRTSLK